MLPHAISDIMKSGTRGSGDSAAHPAAVFGTECFELKRSRTAFPSLSWKAAFTYPQ